MNLRGDWKDLEFKEYNLNAGARPIDYGCDHPLLKVSEKIIILPQDYLMISVLSFLDSFSWFSLIYVISV